MRKFYIFLTALFLTSVNLVHAQGVSLVQSDLSIHSPSVQFGDQILNITLQFDASFWTFSNISESGVELLSGTLIDNKMSLSCLVFEGGEYTVILNRISFPQSSFKLDHVEENAGCSGFTLITELEIPDPNFARCITEVSQSNNWKFAEEISELNCSRRNIVSLAGIENFSEIQHLNLSVNSLSFVDLRQLSALSSLDISNNFLGAISIFRNELLSKLDLSNNLLGIVWLQGNELLLSEGNRIDLSGNPLTKFGVEILESISRQHGVIIERDIALEELTYSHGQLLFDIDFSGPTHEIGSKVTIDPGSIETPTRVRFGTPTIVNEPGILSGNSLLFNSADSPNYYEQIWLDIVGDHDQYFISFDVQFQDLVGSGNQFTVAFDAPQVRNLTFDGSSAWIRTDVTGGNKLQLEPVSEFLNQNVIVGIDAATQIWSISVDDKLLATDNFLSSNLDSIRFNLSPRMGPTAFVARTNVYLDNIVLATSIEDILNPQESTLRACVEQAAVENDWYLVKAVSDLDCSSRGITTLVDLENFTNLTDLRLDNNLISKIDVTELVDLRTLNVSGNQLTTIDVSANKELKVLDVSNNPLNEAALEYLNNLAGTNGLIINF